MIKLDEITEEQRNFFLQGATLEVDFRIGKLKILKSAVLNYKEKIVKALYDDLRKPELEAYSAEILPVLDEINLAIKNVKKWAAKETVKTPFLFGGGPLGFAKSFILKEPFGNVLIISPFNYPIQLALVPLIGALAAGNTVIIKPSKETPASVKVLTEMLNGIFPREYVYVLDPKTTLHFDLLSKRFDYIFFTGSTQTGKKVMEAASKHLTPVTLELGGKSPVVVTKSANLKNAAKAIARGKLVNAGQTCVAPDYALACEDIKDAFLEKLFEEMKIYLGPVPQESENFGRIINTEQFRKLKEILKAENEKIIFGGEADECGLFISPSILNMGEFSENAFENPSMKNEIFGPILPVFTYKNLNDVIKLLKTKEKPLAAYIFTEDEAETKSFLTEFSFGGGCVNETLLHLVNNELPFGGTGFSGLGRYHGKYTFDTFTHKKSIFKKNGDKTFKFLSPVGSIETLAKIKKMLRFFS